MLGSPVTASPLTVAPPLAAAALWGRTAEPVRVIKRRATFVSEAGVPAAWARQVHLKSYRAVRAPQRHRVEGEGP